MREARLQETEPEHSSDEQEQEVQNSHPNYGISRLGKEPCDGREANEQQCHKHQESSRKSADFRESRVRSTQASKNVKTGETNQR